MITFEQVSKQFGGQVVLADASFQVNPGEHVGIVGPNGAGKSTIFNMIVDELTPDAGSIQVPSGCRIGYVRQQLHGKIGDETLLAFAENALPELVTIERELERVETELAELPQGASARDAALERFGELQERYEHLDGYSLKHRAEQTLGGLGFQVSAFTDPLGSLSGGWLSRAQLARVLVANPDVLLLDEPSNYLDIPAIEWLQRFLREFKGSLLLISHDRYLLNSLTSVTIEVANGLVDRYPGNYDYYAQERGRRSAQLYAAAKNQQRKREQIERFIERFRSKNTKATQVQSRIKQLEKMEVIEVPREIISRGSIRLKPPPHCGVEIVRVTDLGVSYDGSRWVLRGLDFAVERGEKIALVGHNGLGKTTLLRVLAGQLEPTEGQRVLGHKVLVGYQSQDFQETMDPQRTVFETVRGVDSESSDQQVRTLLGGFGFSGEAVEKRVHVLSGGEKIRLAFARLLIKPPNFLLLDEPTTHLDIQARLAMEEALRGYEGTLCLVSHDIDFVRNVATSVVAMKPPGVTRYAGDYDYYKRKVEESGTGEVYGQRSTREPTTSTSSTQPNRKEQRRERALARQEIYARTKDLKKQLTRAEKQISLFESERETIVNQLATPEDGTDFGELNKRLHTIQGEIDRYTALWEETALEIEELSSSGA